MAWSPDQELVLFVTDNHKLILMTRDFDIISEQSASQIGFGEGSNLLQSISTTTLYCILQLSPLMLAGGRRRHNFMDLLGKLLPKANKRR